MNRTTFALLLLTALFAAGSAQADEGSAIKHRLEAAKYTTVPFQSGRGPKPSATFYVVADFASRHAFEFFVFVYRSHANAETGYGLDLDFLDNYGTSGASQLEVDGRVLYWGATGPMNHGSGPNPTLPPARFRRMVALARGS